MFVKEDFAENRIDAYDATGGEIRLIHLQTFQDYRLGYQNVVGETSPAELSVIGKIPLWLKGDLIRNGPAKYSIGNETLNHWFDGYAMVHRFSFNESKLSYTSKFLKSDAYNNALNANKICSEEFATTKKYSLVEKLIRPFIFKPTDNSNVNVIPWNSDCLAMTETPYPIIFDRSSLDTLGHLVYEDSLSAQLVTAHPHFDSKAKTIVNVATQLGAMSKYIIFAMNPGSSQRKPIASIPVKRPGYLHSFAITENHIVLVEFPLVINPLELLFSGKPFIENYHWQSQQVTRIFVVDKPSGNVVGPLETDSCFAFHHINSFEQEKKIIVDLLSYPDSSFINSLYLANLMSGKERLQAAQFYRLEIDINNLSVKKEKLFDNGFELPRINYRGYSANYYQYAYAVGQSGNALYLDRLTKMDLANGELLHWQEDKCFPGEPVFVSCPDSDAEDAGIVLSVVLDVKNRSSFILILDAKNMQERARAIIPNIMPFGFHGQFMENRDAKN